MRRFSLLLLMVAFAFAPLLVPVSASAERPGPITVMTYNVRARTSGDALNPAFDFFHRRQKLAAVVNAHNPSIFGLQEVTVGSNGHYSAQWFIRKFAPEYKVFRAKGSGNPKLIFYRAGRLSVAKYTDGSPMRGELSLPTDSKCGQPHRTISWIVLRERHSKNWYWVANTHYPLGTACWSARVHSSNLIHWLIGRTNPRNFPVILTGDFNNRPVRCEPRDPRVQGRPIARLVERPNARHVHDLDATVSLRNCEQTIYGWWPAARPRKSKRVDFIFHSRKLKNLATAMDTRRTVQRPWGGKASPSDHYALVARLQVKR